MTGVIPDHPEDQRTRYANTLVQKMDVPAQTQSKFVLLLPFPSSLFYFILRVHLFKLGTVKQRRACNRRSNRRETRRGYFGSLEMVWERSEPRQGCCQLTGK